MPSLAPWLRLPAWRNRVQSENELFLPHPDVAMSGDSVDFRYDALR